MATFQDNINTIQTAVYGKEMRPAISEALTQSWDNVQTMMAEVDKLNLKIENLSGGGSGVPGEPIEPETPDGYIAVNSADIPTILVVGIDSPLMTAGSATIL